MDGTGDTDVHVAPVSHVHPSSSVVHAAVVHFWAIFFGLRFVLEMSGL